MVSGELVPQWQYELVTELLNADYASIEVVIISDRDLVLQDSDQKVSFIFRLHYKVDRLLFLGENNYAVNRNILNLTQDVRRVKLDSNSDQESGSEILKAFTEIKGLGLDVIIKLGYGKIREELAVLSKYGLWTFPMTGSYSSSADTTGYYEVMENKPVTVSGLDAILGKGQKPLTLVRTIESTCSYSVSLNREKLFRRASLFVPRMLKVIWENGPSCLTRIRQWTEGQDPVIMFQLPAPSWFQSLVYLFKAAFKLLQQILKKIIYTDPFTWVLLYQPENGNDFESNSYKEFKELKPPTDRFWADPFVAKSGDRYYIFVEEFIYKTNKGHISVLEMDHDGNLLKTDRIIANPYHMSYPFVFESDSTWYMIPETGNNRSIDLYQCTEFPWKWEFVKSIMKDINAVDTTLLLHDGIWWLFTLVDRIDSSLAVSPELYLFHSDDFLTDNWITHPMNPVVSDVRYARPAGKVFTRDDILYRPSQDCSGRYGNSFDINQIVVLTKDQYEEKRICKVRPDWDSRLRGTHTFNSEDGFTIIDAYKLRRRFF